ncbi:hypothetical protein P171DRAFT_150070 [Karstenula rhodostoma CBS 690.94]|uniref:Uncharacterized protein n=1 Tax=Karstenula rhodostoma CBS 690.94 TaxID=1392251 RepID=A0A9P4PVE6_9PLEO|nr:hypothetical protein P171DRAFT_150070 [Karstenula rhodostoma CBS 690.94]
MLFALVFGRFADVQAMIPQVGAKRNIPMCFCLLLLPRICMFSLWRGMERMIPGPVGRRIPGDGVWKWMVYLGQKSGETLCSFSLLYEGHASRLRAAGRCSMAMLSNHAVGIGRGLLIEKHKLYPHNDDRVCAFRMGECGAPSSVVKSKGGTCGCKR